MAPRPILALAAGIVLCAPLVFRAQVSIPSREKAVSKPPDEVPRSDLRVDRTEVLVPVAVNDIYNRPVSGLDKENFRVFEDKIEQKLDVFKREDIPVSMGLVIDNSGSMREKRPQVNAAALTLENQQSSG